MPRFGGGSQTYLFLLVSKKNYFKDFILLVSRRVSLVLSFLVWKSKSEKNFSEILL